LRFIAFILLITLASSCYEVPDCLINNTNLMKVALKSKTDGSAISVAFSSIYIVNLNAIAYENQEAGNLQLPVDPNSTETTFIFNYASGTDTLVVKYRNETRLINPDCGAFLYQKDLDVAETDFYEVRVINNILLKDVTTNLEILL